MDTSFFRVQRIGTYFLWSSVFVIAWLSLPFATTARAATLTPTQPAILTAVGVARGQTVSTGACNFTAVDEASLTQAIDCVNLASSGKVTIEVAADILLTQPSVAIVNPVIDQLVIAGNGHSINAQGHGRVLDVQSVQQLAVRDLILSGGNVVSDVNGIAYWGGGLRYYCGDGQTCHGVLNNVTLINNQAVEGGGFALYCYVDTTCSAKLIDSTVFGNDAQAGGGITTGFDEENFAYSLQLVNSAVFGNRAEVGGGIRLRGADFTATNSTIRDNHATAGGGLAMVAGSYSLRAELLGTTISGNVATQRGGGIYARSADPGDVNLTLANSTVSGNQVTEGTGMGGGLAISATYGVGVDLLNSTITNNHAPNGAGLHFALEDDSFAPATLIRFGNSIIAGNQNGSNCVATLEQAPVKGVPLLTSQGHNVDSDGTCLTPAIQQPGDLPSANPNLGPLTDNGGTTFTHALLAGSAAIDAGDNALCAAAPVNGVDQRGKSRPQGAACDIGAYEFPDVAACTYPTLVANDEATLTQAIDCLNVAAAGAYTLTIAADIAYSQPMFRLDNPALTTVIIAGNGHTLDAQGHGRVLTLNNVQALTLRDLTLTGGKVDVNDLAPDGGGLAFDCEDNLACTWTLVNIVVRNNQAESAGGIDYFCSAGGGGALIVQDSVIRDNQATLVGGGLVYSTDEDSQACSVTLRNTLIEGNQALDGGGIRIFRPRVIISDSTIRNNIATQFGGGFMARISDGFIDMTILRSTISGNRAGMGGGGVYIASPDQWFDIKFINSTFSGNTVDNGAGGGLYLQEREGSLRIALINSTVTQNAGSQGAGIHIFNRAESSDSYTGTLRLTNSIVADNVGSDCAGEVTPGLVFTAQRVLSFGHNLDGDGTCLPEGVRQSSDLPNGNANLGPLADNSGATFTHALLTGSQALDAGNDTVCAADPVSGVDQRGIRRPQGAACDIGAYEAAAQPVATNLLFVSAHSSAKAGAIPFRDEDILAYDFNNSTWSMVFDGSDVGVTKDVDAFTFLADGSLLLSFNGPTTVPGLGAVDDSDIVQFIPTVLGTDTVGSFAWFLQGADVGLTTDGEDIDLIDFSHERLLVSTIGDFATPTVSGKDEDLIQLDNATFGTPSSGVWSLFFDGSTVGLANEDVNGLWIDPTNGDRYLTVKDSFAFDGQAVDADDIFVCTPTLDGGCTYRLFWDGDRHDYGSENIDSIHLGPLPTAFVAGAQTGSLEPISPEAAAEDEDVDDLDVVEVINNIFLPLVER